jgi:putative flavoprotein involved in K+ transport
MTTHSAPITGRIERFDTVVIGGGQAGLAMGHHLKARNLDFVILESDARVGDGWRHRWDSLRLFTPAAYSGLPGMPFPGSPAHLPHKDEVADYLEAYAERFHLPVRRGTRVESLSWNGKRFVIRAGEGGIEAGNVVVATGPFQRPKLPPVAARLAPDIHQVHSRDYHRPSDLPDGAVLVVGVGNSGAQIALELARTRRVWLAGHETGRIPRRLLGRDIYDWIWPVMKRLSIDTRLGRRLRERTRRGDPLVGISPREIADAGVIRVGRLTEERGGLPVCDGEVIEPSAIVWSTGFAPDYRWIDLPIFDATGFPRHRRGVATEAPGLFFVGLRFQYRMTSALIGGVGDDAAFIAGEIAARRAMTGSA